MIGIQRELRTYLDRESEFFQCGFGVRGFLPHIIRQGYGFRSFGNHHVDAVSPMQRITVVDGSGNHLPLWNLVVEGFRPIGGESKIIQRLLCLVLRLADDIGHSDWLWPLRHRDGDRRIMRQCGAGIHT